MDEELNQVSELDESSDSNTNISESDTDEDPIPLLTEG